MAEYFDIKKAARLLGCTEQWVRRKCEAGKLNGAAKVGGRWEVPVTADVRLLGIGGAKDSADSAELLGVPVRKRDEAVRRLGHIRQFEKFAANYHGTRMQAAELYCASHGLNIRTFWRWVSKYRSQGLLGLVDNRGWKLMGDTITPEAFELFKSMYLTQQQLSVKLCWQNVTYINSDQNRGWRIPPLGSMYRYIKDHIPLPVQILMREGLAAYQAKCAPYIEIDPDSVAPGAVWIGDHHQLNCWRRYRGRWIRPWITAWEDMRSRTLVGYYISAAPNQSTILLAFKRAVDIYGPPEAVKIDNGRDYDSQMWTGRTKAQRKALRAGYLDEKMLAGIYAMLDVTVSFAIYYHPQSKPVERWFDTLDVQFTKTLPTYCGKDSARKPDYLPDLLASKKATAISDDMGEFEALVGRYIEVYNRTAHTGRGMDSRAPADVMATRESRRVLAEGVTDLLLRVWSGELTVGKNGVRLKGIWYGQYDTELMMYQGKKVRVAYDPDDMRQVYIYNSSTMKLIAIAEQARLIGYGDRVSEEALRDAMRQKAKAVKVAKEFRNSRLTANMDLTSLTIRAMEDAAVPPDEKQQKALNLKPVHTPLDKQTREHERRGTIKLLKKAAGAESFRKALDIDLSILLPPKRSSKRLFNNG